MNIRYRVTLTTDERQQLEVLVRGGTSPARRIKRAQILLAEDGVEPALNEAPRPGAPRKLGVADESLLIAVACSEPPDGRAKWTMDLLAGEMVRLTSHKTLSRDTVGRRLDEM